MKADENLCNKFSNTNNQIVIIMFIILLDMCIGVDPTRDIVTLNEDLTSECIDSELESCMRPFELPLINHDDVSRLSPQINFENEDFITNPGIY